MKNLTLTLTILIAGLSMAAQQAGTLDVTFNNTGIRIFDVLPNVGDKVTDVAVQDDGKIVVIGATGINFDQQGFAARFNPNGTFDSTFHMDGIVTIDMSNENFDNFIAMHIKSDGKILIAGETMLNNNLDLLLVQLMPDGSLDPNFGTLGVTKLDLGEMGSDRPKGMLVYVNGLFFVCGETTGGSSNDYAFITKFGANGTPDNTFGTSGTYKWDHTNAAVFYDLVGLSNGDLIACGYKVESGDARAVLRGLTSLGVLNNGFGIGGEVSPALTTSQPDILYKIALTDNDTKILTGGVTNGSSDDLLIAKFSLTGGTDVPFGSGGFSVIDFTLGGNEKLGDMVIEPDGKILIAGDGVGSSFVARLHSDGYLDYSFNGNGYWIEDLSPANGEGFEGIALDDNGNVISAGSMYKAGMYSPVTVRHHLYENTGVKNPDNDVVPLMVYPNPVAETLYLRSRATGAHMLEVIALDGRVIIQKDFLAIEGELIGIDCSHWATGTYFIKLSNPNQHWIGSAVKQ